MSAGFTNVVATWRERAAALGRQGWRCAACGRIALARRRVCATCGKPARAERAALPARGTVVALCSAGAAVEHLDQVTGRRAAVLVELGGGQHIACLLAHADSIALLPALRGQPVRLAVRRMSLAVPDGEPIPYGLKAAVDLETRSALKAQAKAAKAAKEG
jgi:uncharacterized OB-fold protein